MNKHPLYNTTGLQKDNKSHVLYALANKQMELKRLEDEYRTKIIKIKSDLSALEHTICLFDSDCSEIIAKKVLVVAIRSETTFDYNISFVLCCVA